MQVKNFFSEMCIHWQVFCIFNKANVRSKLIVTLFTTSGHVHLQNKTTMMPPPAPPRTTKEQNSLKLAVKCFGKGRQLLEFKPELNLE